MAYWNLKKALDANDVMHKDVAAFLGMSANNFSSKVQEKVPFTVDEIRAVRDKFLTDYSIDYLTETEGRKATAKH